MSKKIVEKKELKTQVGLIQHGGGLNVNVAIERFKSEFERKPKTKLEVENRGTYTAIFEAPKQ
jgi:hypothetical protein